MAVTSPDNIWTPDSGDVYALTVDLARTADDIQDALNNRVNVNRTSLIGTIKGVTTVAPSGWSGLNTSAGSGTTVRNNGFGFGTGAITVPQPGLYMISASVSFPTTFTGNNRGIRIYSGVNPYAVSMFRGGVGGSITLNVSALCAVSGSFSIQAIHDHSGSLNVTLEAISALWMGN